jgi:hypothetical protein
MNDLSAAVQPITDFDVTFNLGGHEVGMTFEVYGTWMRGFPGSRETPREPCTIDLHRVMCNGVDVTHWVGEDWFSTAFWDAVYER